MSNSSTRLTDKKLKLLYGLVLEHYKRRADALSIDALYDEMYGAIQYALESPLSLSPFYSLDRDEKTKAYIAFHTIFNSLPKYRELDLQQRQTFDHPMPQYNPNVIYVVNEYNYYNYNDPNLINWMILCSLTRHPHGHMPIGGSCCWPSHHHGHSSSSNDDSIKLMALLVIIALALIAIILALIALCYMLHEVANGIERFYYDEGWLKAALILATSVAFGAGSTLLTLTFGAAPLIFLAVAAGLNPVGIVIVGTILLTVIGAGIGCFAMSLLYDGVNQSLNQDAMDPSDPERFRLTTSEEALLEQRNIDPIAVRCAMIALRAEMARSIGSEKPIPSFFSRFFKKENEEINELLTLLRHLRKGDLTTVTVGDLFFDCRLSQRRSTQEFYPNELLGTESTQYLPSAPPL